MEQTVTVGSVYQVGGIEKIGSYGGVYEREKKLSDYGLICGLRKTIFRMTIFLQMMLYILRVGVLNMKTAKR